MQTVLITGGTSGIGAATARMLAGRGFGVVVTGRREPSAQLPPGVRWQAMDVCDEGSVRAGVSAAGELDAVVCNAGFGVFGSLEEVSLERARAQFDTNVFGVLAVLRAALPGLRARKGRVVLVGSLAGRVPIPFQVHYSATKAAVDSIAQGLRLEVAPFGVKVSLIEPGDIQTAFNDATDWGAPEGSPYEARLKACREVIHRTMAAAPAPGVVAEVIHRALTARRPRVRYQVGPEAWTVPLGRRLLPDDLALRLVARHYGI
ncbi:MAG TPA: SDR family oxidoreductase [Myxococcota bacterium]|nr:SDR family oxidoreductase [Myxococcota bacterium]HRY96536.1 SDR family oxidoreductase [Myxococcota bacterium]